MRRGHHLTGTLGVDNLHAPCRESTSYAGTPRSLSHRAAPGHARLDHPPDPALGPTPRLRPRADDPRDLAGSAPGGNGVARPGPAAPREATVDLGGLGRLRERTARPRVPADCRRPQAAPVRALALGAALQRHRADNDPAARE